MLHTNGAQHLLECDEYMLRWLTDYGLQRLTYSSTNDDLDDYVLLEMDARWANKS